MERLLLGVYTHGGRKPRGGIDAVEWARKVEELGAGGEILLTSMDTDGTKEGFDIPPLTKAVANAVDIPVIASGGGAGRPEHFYEPQGWSGGGISRFYIPLRRIHGRSA